MFSFFYFFFFQAEDGIRDVAVTGVQTCALPIFVDPLLVDPDLARRDLLEPGHHAQRRGLAAARGPDQHHKLAVADLEVHRSEERRVGKECRSRWSPYH